jgi:hypothetical protein
MIVAVPVAPAGGAGCPVLTSRRLAVCLIRASAYPDCKQRRLPFPSRASYEQVHNPASASAALPLRGTAVLVAVHGPFIQVCRSLAETAVLLQVGSAGGRRAGGWMSTSSRAARAVGS